MSQGERCTVVNRRDSVDNGMVVFSETAGDAGKTYIRSQSLCNRSTRAFFALFFTLTHDIIPRLDPAKILSVQATGGVKSQQNASVVKKITLKQGDPVQLVCNVAGYPEPTVQWTKRVSTYNSMQCIHVYV
jgi:hypothetical protein